MNIVARDRALEKKTESQKPEIPNGILMRAQAWMKIVPIIFQKFSTKV